MDDVKPALESAGFVVAPTSYGQFSVLRFLAPFYGLRKKAIDRVATDIRTAIRAYKLDHDGADPKRMSVISHSFGTYVVGRLLTDHPEFQWYRVIFCGSVVREDFPLDQVLGRFKNPLLNEIGTKDVWPALAESAGWGYGSVGSTGFNRTPVETRWHHGFRHSDFLTESFCKHFWVPFLEGKKPEFAGKSERLPLYIRLLTMLPLRWMILGAVALGLVLVMPRGPVYLEINAARQSTTTGVPPAAQKTSAPSKVAVVCHGEHLSTCRSHAFDVFEHCGDDNGVGGADPNLSGRNICGNSNFDVSSAEGGNIGGNHCGYSWYRISCK
jgi:pimeloyl-ACP methyl ester carboxylesterase